MERKKALRKRSKLAKEGAEEFRVRTPKGKEVLGIVEIRLGYGKSRIRCTDGKTRLCKVPGAMKRRLWVRPGDVVLVEPWEIEGDKKGNIIHSYTKSQVNWLTKNGYLKDILEAEEF